MDVELQINNSNSPSGRYVGWSPTPCRVRMTNPAGATSPTVNLTLSSTASTTGGSLVFRLGTSGTFSPTLTVSVPTSGATVSFFCAGSKASTNDGDVTLQARFGTTPVGSVPLMVRIRKNAESLTTAERDRFVNAFAMLNNQGLGRFTDFRDMHVAASSSQAHGAPAFLPWHRAYILDLERELQVFDPSVALPYWRFDQPAPNLFTPQFLGSSNPSGNVTFSSTNPLRFWRTDGTPGIQRAPRFNTTTGWASVMSESSTLGLGGTGAQFAAFRSMEGNPHGLAHTSFFGWISDIPTAAKDPLFFLLHCNVDRLWAKWQKMKNRFNPATAAAFDNSSTRVGHRLADTMWPWNGVTTPPRPPFAPGGSLAASPFVNAPGLSPRVQDLLDYQGVIDPLNRQGFDYDDVPFA